MKGFKKVISTLAFAIAMPAVFANIPVAKQVEIKQPYIRATVPGQQMSSAYFDLLNDDTADHVLVGVTSPVADQVQIHVSIDDHGTAKMRRIDQVSLGSHRDAILKPGGMHVMLIGLNQELKSGDEIPLTLAFEDGSSKTIKVPVQSMMTETQHQAHHG